jgi:hypothetical protein
MLSEYTSDKTVNLMFRTGKFTYEQIPKIIKILEQRLLEATNTSKQGDRGKKWDIPDEQMVKHGRQTLKQLSKQNEGLSSIELKQPDLRLLNKIMKKHGVNFAAAKDGKIYPVL